MKSFNIMVVYRKIQFLKGCMKNQYIGGDLPKKRVLDSLKIWEGVWKKRGRHVFEVGVETPMHTINWGSLRIDTMPYRSKISKANNIVWH